MLSPRYAFAPCTFWRKNTFSWWFASLVSKKCCIFQTSFSLNIHFDVCDEKKRKKNRVHKYPPLTWRRIYSFCPLSTVLGKWAGEGALSKFLSTFHCSPLSNFLSTVHCPIFCPLATVQFTVHCPLSSDFELEWGGGTYVPWRKTKNMTCHLFTNKNKENKEKLVRKQQLFFRAHSAILPHAVAKMKDKLFFFYFLIVWYQKATNIFFGS